MPNDRAGLLNLQGVLGQLTNNTRMDRQLNDQETSNQAHLNLTQKGMDLTKQRYEQLRQMQRDSKLVDTFIALLGEQLKKTPDVASSMKALLPNYGQSEQRTIMHYFGGMGKPGAVDPAVEEDGGSAWLNPATIGGAAMMMAPLIPGVGSIPLLGRALTAGGMGLKGMGLRGAAGFGIGKGVESLAESLSNKTVNALMGERPDDLNLIMPPSESSPRSKAVKATLTPTRVPGPDSATRRIKRGLSGD